MTTQKPFNLISMIGLGYIGLPTAAVIASSGNKVLGIDVNSKTVDTINRGEIHIVEPKLDEIVRDAVAAGNLRAATTPETADAYLIAVPTPITNEKKADLSYVLSAGKAIAPVLKKGDLVVLESTSPIGATETLVEVLASNRSDLRFPTWGQKCSVDEIDIHVAYCPERVLPGKVVEELISNDRAIGGMTKHCTDRAMALYGSFVEGTLFPTDTRSAELCKLAENAFRDVNIAYANELANVCEAIGMNVWEVIALANRHPRVNILQPGPGVGGHCIAVDPWFIAETAPDDTPLIQAARNINDSRPSRVIDRVEKAIARFLMTNGDRNKDSLKIACYGLAFKPDIDDLRESPALKITGDLARLYPGSIWAVEPNVENLPEVLSHVALTPLQTALDEADIHVLLVDHAPFKEASLQSDYIIDAKGIWSQI
jgi:UDP-N-acetyl-D-mannosaminuronic acid dehydrogenase